MDSSNIVNIPTYIKDPNYRYQMPKIIVSHQGSGGGVKTKFENIKEVAHALKVPMDYPLKFIGKELGSMTEQKKDVYLINGNVLAEKMQEILDKFIEKYILCPKCKLPETRIFFKKEKNEIRCKCRACGTISKLDEKHEFSKHIKRFPPNYTDEPILPSATKIKGTESTQQSTGPILADETVKNIKSATEKISKYVQSQKELDPMVIEDILNEYKFSKDVKYYVLANGLFDKNIFKLLRSRIPVIKHFVEKEKENVDEVRFYLLIGLTDLLFKRLKKEGDYSKYVSSILYYLYDADIITEDFWTNYAIRMKLPTFKTVLYSKEYEEKLLTAASEFTNWIETGPYEDSETASTMTNDKENVAITSTGKLDVDEI